jgi:hypothetical protein
MRRTLLIAAMLAASVVATDSAFAGTYQVAACAGPTLLINNSWLPFNNNSTYLETSANCGSEVTGGSPSTSGLAAADILNLSTNVPAGATAGWRFIPPAGDTISAISIDRDLYEQTEGWVPQIVEADGHPLLGETCPFNVSNIGCEASGAATHTGLDTTSLAIELLCDPEPLQPSVCDNGVLEHDARVELNSAIVTVTDEQPPQIVSTSGSLFTGGLVRGTVSGTIDGSDSSGVQFARVYVDGAQVTQQASSCDFTRPAPCPASSSNQFSLDTTTLSNGPHQVQAAVVDVAGNQILGSPVQITVENSAPAVPTTPTTPTTPPPPSPVVPSTPAKASPRLRILSVTRRKRALHVRGAAAKTLIGQVTIVVHYTLGGRSHRVQKIVRVTHGAWAVVIGLPGGAKTNRVTVLYRSTARWLAQTVTRYVHHRADTIAKNRQGGQGAVSRDRGHQEPVMRTSLKAMAGEREKR